MRRRTGTSPPAPPCPWQAGVCVNGEVLLHKTCLVSVRHVWLSLFLPCLCTPTFSTTTTLFVHCHLSLLPLHTSDFPLPLHPTPALPAATTTFPPLLAIPHPPTLLTCHFTFYLTHACVHSKVLKTKRQDKTDRQQDKKTKRKDKQGMKNCV